MTTTNNDLLPFPKVLRVEPASQCNLSCSHCPTGTVDMARSVMSQAVFERVLEKIEKHKNSIKVVVLYHGGEPLLNRNFYNMVKAIKKINESIFIKTVSNGVALTLEHSKQIIDSMLDLIEFSLDGESSSESQFVREKSNTEKIVKNIEGLINLKKTSRRTAPEIYISTTQFLRNKNPKNILNEPPVPIWLEKIFSNKVAGFKATYALKWPHMGDTGKYDFYEVSGADSDSCDHVINTMTIRADGTVVPCCYDLTSKLNMGNIMERSLTDIWENVKYNALRKSIESKKYYSICANCAVVRPPTYLIPKWTQQIYPV